MFGYGLGSYCFCILGVQTNFIKKIKSIVQAIPCLTRSMFFKLFLKTLKFEFVLKGSGAEFHIFRPSSSTILGLKRLSFHCVILFFYIIINNFL